MEMVFRRIEYWIDGDRNAQIKLDKQEWNAEKDVYLAGSSVHFDRSFLAEALPELLPRMSHRVLDVSTLKVIAKLWRPELEGFRMGRPPAHRVIEDLEASMAELRHWGSVLLRAGTGPVEALSLLG